MSKVVYVHNLIWWKVLNDDLCLSLFLLKKYLASTWHYSGLKRRDSWRSRSRASLSLAPILYKKKFFERYLSVVHQSARVLLSWVQEGSKTGTVEVEILLSQITTLDPTFTFFGLNRIQKLLKPTWLSAFGSHKSMPLFVWYIVLQLVCTVPHVSSNFLLKLFRLWGF